MFNNYKIWFFCAIISLLIPDLIFSQKTVEDSIRLELNNLENDSLRFSWIKNKTKIVDPSLARIYTSHGIELAMAGNHQKSLVEMYIEEAIAYNRQGDLQNGLDRFIRADSMATFLLDSVKIAAIKTNLGLTYFYIGQLEQAFYYYYQAHKIYQYLNEPAANSRLLNNLAIAHKYAGNLSEAKINYVNSLAIKKELKDTLGEATSLMNIGLLLSELHRIQDALDTLVLAQELYAMLKKENDVMSCQLARGKVMLDAHFTESAEPLITTSYQYFTEHAPGSRDRILAAGDLAILYQLQAKWHLARQYADEAVELGRTAGMDEFVKNLLKVQADIYAQLGDHMTGYQSLLESYNLSDTLNKISSSKLREEMEARFRLDQKEMEINLLQTRQELNQSALHQARFRIRFLTWTGIILALFSLLLILLYRRIRRQNKIIDQTAREKEGLIQEIHHRVKNNLQIISSLLSLQSGQMANKEAIQAVQESQNRVKAMSLIHQELYLQGPYSVVETKEYFEKLISSIFNSYNIDPLKIHLESKIEMHNLDVDKLIPVGLILNELITNSLKHAFPNNKRGNISIKFWKVTQKYNLLVKDDGIGFSQGKENSNSMGMQLIRDFVRKLKGEMNIDSDSGTQSHIVFPD